MAKKNNIGRRPSGTPATGRRNATKTNTAGSEIDGDDELVNVVEVRDQGLDFFERNRNLIVGTVLAIVAVVVGIVIYQTFIKAPAEKNAAAYLQQAQSAFERDSFSIALEGDALGNYGFLDIIDDFGSTKAGNLSQYYAAVSYLNLGKFEAAKEWATRFDADGALLPAMKAGIIGDAESELGNNAAAISNYNDAVDAAGENYVTAGYYLNKLGQLYQKEGQNDEALAAFRRLKQDYGRSPMAGEADKYIVMLEGE
ncbi:tetratricopeptide repeat protein [Neolewinella antarctica]|uniref:Tetratricopeptide (TPR) repeat protein n=1 Tax=Neolewinella antarctica TaxID=442734 RepID=A0ABX0XE04_9BACT|nr:tetratricopeptide repeat protein [Neolewinella antarctica]NJC27447.1 tetratricopeptide (TPR) repeat protein [Neolewinella antarctica]